MKKVTFCDEKDEKKDDQPSVAAPETTDEDEDERILEPLVILGDESLARQPGVEFISRGPVSIEHLDNRFQPYGRPEAAANQSAPLLQGAALGYGKGEEERPQPLPNVLIYTKADREHPRKVRQIIEIITDYIFIQRLYLKSLMKDEVIFT